jgi:DNA-binding NarL/FixJ family response regulator
MSTIQFQLRPETTAAERCESCLKGVPCDDPGFTVRGPGLAGDAEAPAGSAAPRVAICGDQPITRGALRALIEKASKYHVIETAGCATAFALLASVGVEALLVDFDLIDSSAELIGRLRGLLAAAVGLPILILTSEANAEACRAAYESGARGLILKRRTLVDLFGAIERIRRGDIWLEGVALQQILRENGRTKKTPAAGEGLIAQLTGREREIVRAVAGGRSNREVGAHLFISEATVRHHLVKIFDKLEVASRAELMVFAYRHELADVKSLLSN